MASERDSSVTVLSQQLLLGVAEELKLPLMQIARQVELAGLNTDARRQLQTIAQTALTLVDNYILGVRLTLDPQQFPLETVSISSVLYDAEQRLDSFAQNYGVDLELSLSGRYGPVISNRFGLQTALVSLGAALIEAMPAVQGTKQLKLQLAMHRSRYGLVAGIYTDTKQLSEAALRHGRRLQGHSRQPLNELNHLHGAGIFVADTILKAMNLHLFVSRHHRLYGLGTVLEPSSQLTLI
jgi:hypothetical protein